MVNIGLHTITSGLHNEVPVDVLSEPFIRDLSRELNDDSVRDGFYLYDDYSFEWCGESFESYGTHDIDIIYVRTGGTENAFKKALPLLEGQILLLTSGLSNSLAASMEILSYLRQQGRVGEILHGSSSYIAHRIMSLAAVQTARKSLNGLRIGVIGQPSDWLISSDPDRKALQDRLGITLVDIPIKELENEARKGGYSLPEGFDLKDYKCRAEGADVSLQTFRGALDIYGALKRLIGKYSLGAVTVRCFDLLSSLRNTGCLALSILNSEGIPASCEGDIPTLVTMCVSSALTGSIGFQANPSSIDPESGEVVLAHCTIPLEMVEDYVYDTHFESGIGVAIRGTLPLTDVTLFKLAPDLSRCFTAEAELLPRKPQPGLCRTQAYLRLFDKSLCRNYFLKDSIGNHHVIVPGRCASLLQDFFRSI